MDDLPRGGEGPARLRAARGYAGLKANELAEELGISVETMSRLENGRTPIGSDIPGRVAAICKVPPTFMDVGFETLRRPLSNAEARVLELEQRMDERVSRIEALLTDPTREAIEDLRALTGQAVVEADAAGDAPPEPQSHDGADAKTGSGLARQPRKRRSAGGGDG